MKATCPKCGAKDAHEKVVSVVRTWFRCNKCSFAWRGSILAFAYQGSPLGSTRDNVAVEKPAPTALEPARPLDAAEFEAELDAVEQRIDEPTAPTADVGASRDRPLRKGPATRDVNEWPAAPGGAAAATPDARRAHASREWGLDAGADDVRTTPGTPSDRDVEHRLASREPTPAPSATESTLDVADMRNDVVELTAAAPPAPVRAGRPEAPTAAVRRGSLAASLKRLAVFDAELTHVQQQLGKSQHSYSAVVKRWEPIVESTPDEPDEDG